MPKDQLDIFVSGKEGELDDERAIIGEIIESFKFRPISSEKRVASPDPMTVRNRYRVTHSDIYIGIFGRTNSPPTIDEHNTALNNNIPRLIFVKEIKGEPPRDEQLTQFLKPLENSETGIVYKTYENVIDLRSSVIGALSELLSNRFTVAVESKSTINELSSTQEARNTSIPTDMIAKLAFRWGVRYNDDFGIARIVDFQIPTEVTVGTTQKTSAKVKGSINNGFLDLALIEPSGEPPYYWIPDPQTYDGAKDNGKLFLQNASHESRDWEFTIVSNKKGTWKAIMGLFVNDYPNRVCIDYEVREIIVR